MMHERCQRSVCVFSPVCFTRTLSGFISGVIAPGNPHVTLCSSRSMHSEMFPFAEMGSTRYDELDIRRVENH